MRYSAVARWLRAWLSPLEEDGEDGAIKGKHASLIGRGAKPKVPWARFREYALPISAMLSHAEYDKGRMLARKPPEAYTYSLPDVLSDYVPSREFGFSIPYDKATRSENLDEALRLGLITKEQYDTLV